MQEVLKAIQKGGLNATAEILISNNSKSMAMEIADTLGFASKHISSRTHPEHEDEAIVSTLMEHNVDLVICSGWKKIIGKQTLERYPNRIINIHPAIHSKYMGKNWIDMTIHEAVIKDKKSISGYTIHLLDQDPDEIDKGIVLTTGFVRVSSLDTPHTLQQKVKEAEGRGLVSLLQDISNPHIVTTILPQEGRSPISITFTKGIYTPITY